MESDSIILSYDILMPDREWYSTEYFQVPVCHKNASSLPFQCKHRDGRPLSFNIRSDVAAAIVYCSKRSFTFLTRIQSYANRLQSKVRSRHVDGQPGYLYDLLLILRKELHLKIDFAWDRRLEFLSYKWSLLKDATSWLSTLGGGHSALGDYFSNHADTAGEISVKQFRLALALGDVGLEYRCRLYYSLSLMQKGRLREAKDLIRFVYVRCVRNLHDERLENMCHGVWSKLRYEYAVRRQRKCRPTDASTVTSASED